MTSANPSPFTSPAVATEPPKEAPAWLRLRGPGGGRREPRCRAEVDERPPLVGLAVVVTRRPDDDVGVPVAVHVPRRRHRGAEEGAGLVRSRGPGGGRRRAPPPSRGRRTPAPRRSGRCRRGSAPTTTSEKPSPFTSPADATEQPNGRGLVDSRGPGGGGASPAAEPMVDERPALIGLAVVVCDGPDDDIGEPVAVHVPRRRHRLTEPGVGLVRLSRSRQRSSRAPLPSPGTRTPAPRRSARCRRNRPRR